ncbi:MAG: hypothetical protein Q7S43_03530 [bacterium]|nr:hypothetical protein [bacterium]
MRSKRVKGVLLILFATFLLFRGYLVDEDIVYGVANAHGFVVVEISERKNIFPFGCGKTDAVRFKVKARRLVDDQKVGFYVCAGWPIVGATLRTV